MKTNKFISLLGSLSLVLGLSACNQAADTPQSEDIAGDSIASGKDASKVGQALNSDDNRGSVGDDSLEAVFADSEAANDSSADENAQEPNADSSPKAIESAPEEEIVEDNALEEELKELELENVGEVVAEDDKVLEINRKEDQIPPDRLEFSIDENFAKFKGEWQESVAISGYKGVNYHHSMNDGKKKSVIYSLNQEIQSNGYYEVYAYWTAHTNRATNAKFRIVSAHEDDGKVIKEAYSVVVNQKSTDPKGNYLGTYFFSANMDESNNSHPFNKIQKIRLLADGKTDGYVIADGIKLVWHGFTFAGEPGQQSPILLDTTDYQYVKQKGEWTSSTAIAGFDGGSYIHDQNGLNSKGASENKNVRYAPNFAEAGEYEIYVKWTSHQNRGVAVYVIKTFDAIGKAVSYTINVDQKSNLEKDKNGWFKIKVKQKNASDKESFLFAQGQSFKTGSLIVKRGAKSDGYIIADSVKFVKVN